MAKEIRRINIRCLPELLRLAEEARKDNSIFVLVDDEREIARLTPTTKPRARGGRPSAADIAAFRSAAGSWKDVDVDKFLADNYESRRISTSDRVEL
jgi:hypothetical protein